MRLLARSATTMSGVTGMWTSISGDAAMACRFTALTSKSLPTREAESPESRRLIVRHGSNSRKPREAADIVPIASHPLRGIRAFRIIGRLAWSIVQK